MNEGRGECVPGRIRVSNAWSDREAIVVDLLRKYRALVCKHNTMLDLLHMMDPSCTARITDEPRAGSGGNRVERQVIASIEVREQYQKNIAELQANIDSIARLIRTLPDDEYSIIMRRYMLGERMEVVGEKLYMSVRKCWDLHGSGIRRLSENVHTHA